MSKPPIDYDAIDAQRAALKARVLAFIYEGYAIADEVEKQFKVKIPVELYQYTEKGASADFSGPGDPDADVYADADHSAEDFFCGRVWIGKGDEVESVEFGELGNPTAIEGVSITSDDVEWLRWVSAAHVSLRDALDSIGEVHNCAFPDDYDAYTAKLVDAAAEDARRIAERNALIKPAPEEFDPFLPEE